MRSKSLFVLGVSLLILALVYAWYVRGLFAPAPEVPPPQIIETTKQEAELKEETPEHSLTFSWNILSPFPTKRTEVTAAALGGEIYVIGGFNGLSRTVPTVEIYDPTRNTWRQGPPLPTRLHHSTSTVIGSKLYIVGGLTGMRFRPTREVFVFDLKSGEWSGGPALPEPRGAHAVAAMGDILYAVGGMTEEGVSADLLQLDLREETPMWQHLKPAPTPREHLAMNIVDGKLYVSGGRQRTLTSNLKSLEIYDPAEDTWTTGPPLPTARGGVVGGSLGRFFIVFGGEQLSGTFDEAEAFDTQLQKWITLPPMPTARHGLGAATIGNTVYVLGGGRKPGLAVSGANEALVLVEE